MRQATSAVEAGGLKPFDAGDLAASITPSGNIALVGAMNDLGAERTAEYLQRVVWTDSYGLAQKAEEFSEMDAARGRN